MLAWINDEHLSHFFVLYFCERIERSAPKYCYGFDLSSTHHGNGTSSPYDHGGGITHCQVRAFAYMLTVTDTSKLIHQQATSTSFCSISVGRIFIKGHVLGDRLCPERV